MGDMSADEAVVQIGIWLGLATLFVIVVMLPARILQKRHGYSPRVLLFGLVPYLGPLCLLWALAASTPAQTTEVQS